MQKYYRTFSDFYFFWHHLLFTMFSTMPILWEHELLQQSRLSGGEEHAAVGMGRQGLRMFSSAYCQVTCCRKGTRDQRALDSPVSWMAREPPLPPINLCLAGRQIMGRLFKEAKPEGLCFMCIGKGLAAYTWVFSSVVMPTHATQTGM